MEYCKEEFCKEWNRRIWIFHRLIWTVISYGVEIWGWKKREGMERLEERCIRWVFRLDRRTPGYLVREEIKRGKIRERAGKKHGDLKENWRRRKEVNRQEHVG